MPRFAYRCLAVIVAGLLAGGLLTGCGGGSPARSDRWHPVTCWFHNDTKLRIDCGYLTVPLHHDRPGGRPVELAVEVIHAPNPHPQPDPVVVLVGGGGSLVGNGNSLLSGWAPIRLLTGGQGDRDLILLDQRGVGHSRPALDCATVYDLASGLACRNRLTSRGIDLSAYTTEEIAADVAELGSALGYRQVNLFGYSYGSRLALTVMREHPHGIRSVILVSPLPPQADYLTDLPDNEARAFQTLFDGCAHDPRCAAAYPQLARDFRTAIARLDARPVRLTARIDGKNLTGRFDGQGLVYLLNSGFYVDKMAIMPRLIHHAATGGNLADDWAQIVTAGDPSDVGSSEGMEWSIQCADEVPFVNRQRARANDAAHPEQRHAFVIQDWWSDLCARWPTGPVNPAGHSPVHSGIPTLIVTGQYDPTNPPAYGRLAAATLTRGYFTEFPGLGHIPEDPCVLSVEANFLRQPLQRPDSSCIQQMPPIPWKTG